MKKTRPIIVTTLIVLLSFAAAIYTSCTKDRCKSVTCWNGGTCKDGFCTCPRGFEGDHCEIGVTTTIQFWNHGFADLMLTLNNVAYVVPAGHSKGFTGANGDSLKGNAYTNGGHGVQIRWDTVFATYPANGTKIVDFNIPANYFYLFVTNDSSSALLRYVYVDSGSAFAYQGVIDLSPNYLQFGSTVGLGYFHASDTSNVYIKSKANDGQWRFKNWDGTLPLPMTENQSFTAVAQ